MSRVLFAFAATLLLSATSLAVEKEKKAYSFKFDGEAFEPALISLTGHPESPAAGDLLEADRLSLVLDEDRDWELFTVKEVEGTLFRKRGREREVVGVTIKTSYRGDDRKLINPLARMTKDEKLRLRGIRLDHWDEAVAKSLADIDFERTALTITDLVTEKRGKLPVLPKAVRYLLVEESSNQGIRDYSNISDLKSLRVLRVRAMTAQFPAELLAGTTDLRYLQCNNLDPKGIDKLSKLTELRTLNLPFCDDVSDVTFAKHCSNLIHLDIRKTDVADLRPLEGLKFLETIRADQSKVANLPEKLPKLRRIDLFSTSLSDEKAAAFLKNNPECALQLRWENSIRQAAAKADRVRVRSGGTCHRDQSLEKTLIDVKDAKAIGELLSAIHIDERRSGEHCMCCGDPSIEFYEGEKLVATLGFHHGRSLRWVDNWPGDAILAGDSAKKLAKWMSARGLKAPEEDIDENSRRETAAERRMELIEAQIPKDVLDRLNKAKSREALIAAFEEGVPDGVKRVDMYFRIAGCGQGSWSHEFGPEGLILRGLLPQAKKEDVAGAVKAAKDNAAFAGAGRWLFGEKHWSDLPKEGFEESLKNCAEFCLGQPHLWNRRATLRSLKEIGTPGARELLRKVFDGKIEVRKLADEDKVEPPGTVSARPDQLDLERGSDAAQAARLLAELGVTDIRKEIEKRSADAKGDDAKLYQEALKKLEGK